MKTYVCGDVHGAYRALKQILEKVNFNYESDKLIFLGDAVDGWSQSKETLEELLKIKNLIYIMGNHDLWFLEFIQTGNIPDIWRKQGGAATLKSFSAGISKNIRNLLERKAIYYYIENNKLFIHGGFDWHTSIEDQLNTDLIWDRNLFATALEVEQQNKENKTSIKFSTYDEIYIGHTTVTLAPIINSNYKLGTKPLFLSNVIAMDTGAGWEGILTIMDIDTKEYWQSDLVKNLYPEEKGR